MRRADRLFRLVQILRGGKLTTARRLADALEVSERTVYRDVRDLLLSGVPIEGEAGMGYVLRGGFDLPPLMFSAREIEAVVLGARMVQAWGGDRLARHATEALGKIEAVLPPAIRDTMDRVRLRAPGFHVSQRVRSHVDLLHEAVESSVRVRLAYVDREGEATRRTVRPLGLVFWGGAWTLAAWCERRRDFRAFRLDRIEGAELGAAFTPEPGRTLEAYLRAVSE